MPRAEGRKEVRKLFGHKSRFSLLKWIVDIVQEWEV